MLADLWTLLGSQQIGPLITLAQLIVVPLMLYALRRIAAIYQSIAAIPGIKSDVRKLYRVTNQLRRDMIKAEAKIDTRHAENIAAFRGGGE